MTKISPFAAPQLRKWYEKRHCHKAARFLLPERRHRQDTPLSAAAPTIPSHITTSPPPYQAGRRLRVPEACGETPSVGTGRFFHWSDGAQRLQGAEGAEGKGGRIIHKVGWRAASAGALQGNKKRDEVSAHMGC